MSADNTNDTSQTDETVDETDSTKGKDAVSNQLAALGETLRQMNQRQEATDETLRQIAAQRRAPAQEEVVNDYEPSTILAKAKDAFSDQLRAEKAKDMMVYTLAQEYPEIQTDPKVRQAVIDAQKDVPESIRDTAAGYEHAILKATSRFGIIPKSKRQTVDEDTYLAPSGGNRQAPKKGVKISENQRRIAELMGQNVDDPEYIKRLEAANKRDRFDKYR